MSIGSAKAFSMTPCRPAFISRALPWQRTPIRYLAVMTGAPSVTHGLLLKEQGSLLDWHISGRGYVTTKCRFRMLLLNV